MCTVYLRGLVCNYQASWHQTLSYFGVQSTGKLVGRAPASPTQKCLIARMNGPDLVDKLPRVLLGIRTAPKHNLQCSSAELVYGGPLSVPGDFLPSHSRSSPKAAFLSGLRNHIIQQLTSTLMSLDTEQHPYVPSELFECQYVFVRKGSRRPLLVLTYESSFKVKKKKN